MNNIRRTSPLANRLWPLEAAGSRTFVMGILNATPDSFSDSGLHSDTSTAIEHALNMVRDGADIVDIGGESTRRERPTRCDQCDCVHEILPSWGKSNGRGAKSSNICTFRISCSIPRMVLLP